MENVNSGNDGIKNGPIKQKKCFEVKKLSGKDCKIGKIVLTLQRIFCVFFISEYFAPAKYMEIMLESFYRIHKNLILQVNASVRRLLMDEIDWSDRLIGIKGCRGVGKTTFLLMYAKEHYSPDSKECLYVNFNNLYFTQHTLVEFAKEFVEGGGRTLLLDQMFKYDNWSKELKECYDLLPQLHIVFSGSTVMRLVEGNTDLQDIVKMYNLRGFSFREYLNLQTGTSFGAFTLPQIIKNHAQIAKDICQKVHPLWYFDAYLREGFYPFFLEKRNFSENLLKTMNMMLEVDVLLIKQIDVAYLSKLKRLLHIMLEDTPCGVNISKISSEIDVSRATVMNYLKYLKDARLLNLLYMEDKQFPTKPNKVYMQNTNLMFTHSTKEANTEAVAETFFYNALHAMHKINATEREAKFVVDGQYYFDVFAKMPKKPSIRLCARADLEQGEKNLIPLWLFGFLY